ncbi:MAG: cyclic nucleotide-binding domain-containing protein [Pseudomonadota bacterium]|nr:cyclic nucleotide-binding domain-containing protein [Pseudomonadota bacterium]
MDTVEDNGCHACWRRDRCLPAGLDTAQIRRLQPFMAHRRPVAEGTTLFAATARFSGLYIVRSGGAKSTVIDPDGRERIVGLHLAGGLIGVDGLARNRHEVTAQALDRLSLCWLSPLTLDRLSGQPDLYRRLFGWIGETVLLQQRQLLAVSRPVPAERGALLIVLVAEMLGSVSVPQLSYSLPLSRQDIGNFLFLAGETVSRAFSTLSRQGAIRVSGRWVEVRHWETLIGEAKLSRSHLPLARKFGLSERSVDASVETPVFTTV